MELDCRYPSISEGDGSRAVVEAEAEPDDSPTVARVSSTCSPVFLRFFPFLGELSSGISSRFLRFFLRSGCSDAGIPDESLIRPKGDMWSARTDWERLIHLYMFYGLEFGFCTILSVFLLGDLCGYTAHFGKPLPMPTKIDHSPGVSPTCGATTSSLFLLFSFFFFFLSLTSMLWS